MQPWLHDSHDAMLQNRGRRRKPVSLGGKAGKAEPAGYP